LLLPPCSVAADNERIKAIDAYEHVQKIRRDVEKIANAADASGVADKELKGTVAQLQGALEYLARPEIRELAQGSRYLDARRHDVLFDLAGVYARLGDRQRALDAMEAAMREVVFPTMRQYYTTDKAFASLQDEPRFRALLAQMDDVERLWKVPAIASTYKEKLTTEERVAGLSLFWAEARQNFVNFDHLPGLNWDQLYLDTLKRVLAVETTRDYYEVMLSFAPLLRDAHTNVYPPKELDDFFYARPPMRTRLIEDKVLVTQVMSPTLGKMVSVGDEIVSINGQAVQEYARQHVEPYVSSSTPQDRAVRMYGYQLFSGDSRKALMMRIRDATGNERTETIARTGYNDRTSEPDFAFRMTPEGIAYFALDHFESAESVKAFEKILPQIMKAKALVIDLRANGGGSTNHGLAILSYLTDQPIPLAASRIRRESVYDRARGASLMHWGPAGSNTPYARKRDTLFKGPVAVLIGPETFSAAEDFVVSYELLNRGLLIGENTAGSTGQPLSFDLPGGGTARICIKRDSYPDGRDFVGKGIAPKIVVKPTVVDLRGRRDAALERAYRELSAVVGKPS